MTQNIINLTENKTPKYENLDQLGSHFFKKSRLEILCNLFLKFTKDETDSYKQDVCKWITTKMYEGNINYANAKDFVRNTGMTQEVVECVYSDFINEKSLDDLYKISKANVHHQARNKEDYQEFRQNCIESIRLANITDSPNIPIDTGKYLKIDMDNKVTTIQTLKQFKTKDPELSGQLLFNVAPISVTEYEPSSRTETKLFQWTFEEQYGGIFTTPAESLKETADWLKANGYVMNTFNLVGNLTACKQALKTFEEGQCYTLKEAIMQPGFHLKHNKIVTSEYEINEYSDEEIKEAFETLFEYKTWFTEYEREYIGTTFKWGLIAPFNWCYKKRNKYIEWLYLHGEGGVGKTYGYGGLVGHLWFDSLKKGEYFKGQDTYSTLARLRDIVSKSTFPVVLNESEYAFEENKATRNMYKSMVEEALVGDTKGEHAKKTYALGAALCTSNGNLTDETGAITRRSVQMCFTKRMKQAKLGIDKKKFNETWKIGLEESPLNKLRPIAHKFASTLMQEPQLLDENWQETTDKILQDIAESAGVTLPLWLTSWLNPEDNIRLQDEEMQVSFYEHVQDLINKERTVYDDVDNMKELYEVVCTILRGRRISGLYLKNDGKVYLTQSFLDKLHKRGKLEHGMNLKQFAENFDWKYDNKPVRIEKQVTKGVTLEKCEFFKRLYGEEVKW